jgi:predicted ATPase/DNA-binding CsgD family transcriptional regulator
MGSDGVRLPERLSRAGVTEREAEVLWAVAERLRNREIAERFHVSVRTVESHIAALLRKLSVADRAALAEVGLELRRTTGGDAALPVPLTSLVGREGETAELTTLTAGHRLVTLIGPGGVGKTRLALHVAADQADRFPDGARLADLAPVAADLVADTLARALGVAPQPGWPLRDVLREVAGGMKCLLVVDNCEHVIAAAADIVADLLAAGSELRVLATSREPLAVAGEATYQVPPMPVPAATDATLAAASDSDAVRLFVERAAAVSPGFLLTEANVADVAALCRRLDGMPLAIELAAALVRSFAPAELVRHLGQRFELLSAGARTAPPRHRTLRAAIDWSYDLLDEDERDLFDRFGVFPADFDFEAAQAVRGNDDRRDGTVLSLMPRLVDKSLVTTVGRHTSRYRLLESLRVYAVERLAASGAEPAARRRHAEHYLALAEGAAEVLRTAQQRSAVDRLSAEQPNLRAGLAYAVETRDIESSWAWIAALQRFWDITGQRREAWTWIERTLALGEPPATARTVAGLAAASAIRQASDAQASFDLARRAERLAANLDDLSRALAARAVGMGAMWVQPELALPALHDALGRLGEDHPWERALTMQGLAQVAGELAEVRHWGMASVDLFRSVGDQMHAANALFILAQRFIYASIADDEVYEWLTESLALAESAGSEEDRAHARVGFGQLAWQRGDHDRAARLMGECLPTLRRLGDRRCTGRALYMLGARAYEEGQLARAGELLAASVEATGLAGQSFVLVNALEALAAVRHAQDQHHRAAVLLGAAHAARDAATAHMRPSQPPDPKLRESLRQTLGAGALASADAEGRRMTPAEASRWDSPADRQPRDRDQPGRHRVRITGPSDAT